MSSCDTQSGMMPLEQAQQLLAEAIKPIIDIESAAIELARQRVLAVDVISYVNVPGHNNSAMDGFALNTQGVAGTEFTLVGQALAGQPFNGILQPGQCIRIMTGAVVPDTADTVVMQENAQLQADTVSIQGQFTQGANIRMAGEDIAQGEKVFTAGHKLNAVDIGLLASLGISEVQVFRRPVVAILSTGDELKRPGQALSHGDIYDTNRYVLKGLLDELNIEVLDLGIIADDKSAIEQAFAEANQIADAVISSGGVSVGDADYTRDVLESIGQLALWKIAMKPGKPFAFGQLSDSYFFGLPGNPVSATVTFQQLVQPVLEKLSGANAQRQMALAARALTDIKKRPGRADFQRGIATTDEQGCLQVSPLGHQGSGVLSSISAANCYIVLDRDQGNVPAGQPVLIQFFND